MGSKRLNEGLNQRSVAEILQMIRMLGGLIGRADAAEALANRLKDGLDDIRQSAAALPTRPRVFFEEWDEPLKVVNEDKETMTIEIKKKRGRPSKNV